MSDGWAFERLAARRAILFADLVESVRVFQQQEARTFDRWHRYVQRVREQIAPAHDGHLVRVAGDGLLLDFADATSATRAAFELHRQVARFNEPDDPDGAFVLRVGLHVAEVVANQNDLWGAGVNVAQRLSTLARPGATVASAAFRADLGDGVQADIQDLGERIVKHLAEPVRAFALAPPGERPAVRLPSTEDLRPAVAVVPFVAMPADAEHDALGHAMADDVIASLSRHPGLRVLSRASTAVVRGQALALPRLRELLGASFLLTGQFYVRGARVRLNAELAELREGQVLWAGSVGGTVEALFEGQDELVPHLVAQVCQQVLAHELARVRSLPMDSLASYSLLLGAQGLLNSLVAGEFRRSREALDHLVDRHPRQAAPHTLLTQWHVFKVLQGWTDDADTEVALAHEQAALAMEKDPLASRTWVADGTAKVFAERDFEGAARSFREAIRLDPHCATAWARLSECQSEAGEHHASLESAVRAIGLSPLDPQRFIYECYAARSCFKLGDYLQAAEFARASVRGNTMHAVPHRILVASLWFAGQEAEARAAAADLMRLLPATRATDGLSASSLKPIVTPFMRALEAAGVPL
jgi:adenylate cyclase